MCKCRSRPVSRILSAFAGCAGNGVTTIPLAPALLTGSSNLPGDFGRAVLEHLPIWFCSVWGFACHDCRQPRGALLPHLFTLTLRLGACAPRSGRYLFCATVRRVSPPGRYPAHCSVEFGLSSPGRTSPRFRATVTPGSGHPADCNTEVYRARQNSLRARSARCAAAAASLTAAGARATGS
jgi:hypothetical protein